MITLSKDTEENTKVEAPVTQQTELSQGKVIIKKNQQTPLTILLKYVLKSNMILKIQVHLNEEMKLSQ